MYCQACTKSEDRRLQLCVSVPHPKSLCHCIRAMGKERARKALLTQRAHNRPAPTNMTLSHMTPRSHVPQQILVSADPHSQQSIEEPENTGVSIRVL